MEWRFEVGIASREEIMAALLAKQGARSASTAIEGTAGFLRAFADSTEGSELLAHGLGETWNTMNAGFKPFPVCAFNQTPVRTVFDLIKENAISFQDINKVQVRVNPYEYNYAGMTARGPFNSVGGTLMSTPFCVALAFVDGEVVLDALSRFDDPRIRGLMERIDHIPDEGVGSYCCTVTVETKGGKSYHRESREGPEYYNFDMMQTTELARRVAAEGGVTRNKVEKMITFIQGLEQAPAIKELAELLGSCP